MQLDVAVSQDDVDVFDSKTGKDEVFFFTRKKNTHTQKKAVLEEIHLT